MYFYLLTATIEQSQGGYCKSILCVMLTHCDQLKWVKANILNFHTTELMIKKWWTRQEQENGATHHPQQHLMYFYLLTATIEQSQGGYCKSILCVMLTHWDQLKWVKANFFSFHIAEIMIKNDKQDKDKRPCNQSFAATNDFFLLANCYYWTVTRLLL